VNYVSPKKTVSSHRHRRWSAALLLICIWPAAPLWQKLGLEPFCIQASWPYLKIVSCSPSPDAPTTVTPRALPTPSEQGPVPIIIDDDGSPDGTVALLYFLHNPLFEVKAVTISAEGCVSVDRCMRQ
jgi:hypothetical protein